MKISILRSSTVNLRNSQLVKVLTMRNFLLFVSSQTVSQFGDKLDYIALIAIVGLFKERAPFYLSQLALFFTAPVFFFGPISGVLVDRWNRKRIMVICDLLRACLAFLIPTIFLATGNIYLVFVLVFFMFLCALFFNTAKLAIIPDIVTQERVLQANSAHSVIMRLATFMGVALGGFIIDWSVWKKYLKIEGWRMGFYIDAASFLISAIILSLISLKYFKNNRLTQSSVEKEIPGLMKSSMKKILTEMKQALQLIFKDRHVAFAIASVFLLVIAAGAIYVLAIPTIQQDLSMGTKGVGLLAGIGSIGLIVGALVFGISGHKLDLAKVMLIGFIVIGCFTFAFPLIKAYWLIVLLSFLAGGFIQPIFICQDTIIHKRVSEDIRGRIFSVREWTLNVTFALAAAVIGTLSTIITKKILFFMSGLFIAGISIYLWLMYRQSRIRQQNA